MLNKLFKFRLFREILIVKIPNTLKILIFFLGKGLLKSPFSYLQFRPLPDVIAHDGEDSESNFPTRVEDGRDKGSMLDRHDLDGDDVLSNGLIKKCLVIV